MSIFEKLRGRIIDYSDIVLMKWHRAEDMVSQGIHYNEKYGTYQFKCPFCKCVIEGGGPGGVHWCWVKAVEHLMSEHSHLIKVFRGD